MHVIFFAEFKICGISLTVRRGLDPFFKVFYNIFRPYIWYFNKNYIFGRCTLYIVPINYTRMLPLIY